MNYLQTFLGFLLIFGGIAMIVLSFRKPTARQLMLNAGKTPDNRGRWLLRFLGVLFIFIGISVL